MKTEIAIAVGLCLALGCSAPDKKGQPSFGSLNISTNTLLAEIPPGMHQINVEATIGKPCRVMDRGVFRSATNANGTMIEIPMEVWEYGCTNGSMWIFFGTNKVVHSIEPNPGLSI